MLHTTRSPLLAEPSLENPIHNMAPYEISPTVVLLPDKFDTLKNEARKCFFIRACSPQKDEASREGETNRNRGRKKKHTHTYTVVVVPILFVSQRRMQNTWTCSGQCVYFCVLWVLGISVDFCIAVFFAQGHRHISPFSLSCSPNRALEVQYHAVATFSRVGKM